MKPRVTIIMATYNRAHFIVETLHTIQSQTFKDWECLIIDDGGTDNTAVVIAPILEQDNRFQFLKRTESYNKGLPGTRNYGLDIAKGDYVIFFDDDDIVHPQNLELCVLELSRNDVSFCRYIRNVFHGDFDYKFDLSKKYDSFFVGINDVERLLNQNLPFNSCSVLWKKECFTNNRYIEHLLQSEEWELYSRILSTGIRGISIEKSLFFARKHSNSMTGQYYRRDPVRRASKKDAILLVAQNLKEKQLLTYSLLRYFVQLSLGFKEYHLFSQLLQIPKLSVFEKVTWQIFYFTLPLRLFLFGKWKKIKKRLQV
jgi:glycosyltransferase involved in cell wall biosynthesis